MESSSLGGGTSPLALTKPFLLHGSSLTSMEEAPFMVQISVSTLGDRICAGSIISSLLVLTAAHCVYDNDARSFVPEEGVQVTAGDLHFQWGGGGNSNSSNSGAAQTRHVVQFLKPDPPYSHGKYDRDIIILKLNTPLDFNSKVDSVSLPIAVAPIKDPGESARIYGWGLTELDKPAESLRRADVQILNSSTCASIYSSFTDGFSSADQRLLCARGVRNEGGCQGDSGSPLVCVGGPAGTKLWQWLCGITSFGENIEHCSETTKPVGYVSIVPHLEWIQNVLAAHGPPRITPGTPYLFQVTNDNPRHSYIGVDNGLGYIQNSDILIRNRGTWKWKIVAGLADPNCCYSLESVKYPGQYLRHQGYRIKLHPSDGSDLFKEDATFFIRPQRRAGEIRFESYNYPDHYIRHYNSELWISSGKGEGFQVPWLYQPDTTYALIQPAKP